MKILKTIIAAVVFCSIAAAAGAQDDAQHFTLKSLCRAANVNAEQILIRAEDVVLAQEDKKRALAVLIPRLIGYGNYSNYRDEELRTMDTRLYGVKLSQSFTLNGKEFIAYDISKRTISQNEFGLDSVRSDYMLQVSEAYFNTLSSKQLLEIAEADVKRLETHKNSVQEKLNVGSVTKTDLFRAQAELSKSKTDLVVAEHRILQNEAQIVQLTGVPQGFSISDKDVPKNLDDFKPDLEKVKAAALANRYEIKEAEKALEVAHRSIELQRGDYWPSVTIEGGFQESDTDTSYITAECQFTIYDNGLRRAEINQAKAREKKAKESLDLAKKNVLLQSEVAYLEFETAKKTLINLHDELKSAEENWNAVSMQFKYGLADSIDLMDANTLLVTAQRRISNARYSYYQAALKLIHTQGGLLAFLLEEA